MMANEHPTDDGRLAGNGSGAAANGAALASGEAQLLGRVLGLEAEVRTLRALLDVRNEAFRALMARLVAVELRAQAGECDRVTRERDDALALANALQNMKIFRYSKWPRDAYGVFLRAWRRLR